MPDVTVQMLQIKPYRLCVDAIVPTNGIWKSESGKLLPKHMKSQRLARCAWKKNGQYTLDYPDAYAAIIKIAADQSILISVGPSHGICLAFSRMPTRDCVSSDKPRRE
jgi:hypothetical protein